MEFLRSIVHLQDVIDSPDTVIWDLERRGQHVGVGGVREIPFTLFGPYKSNNNEVNNHARCLVVSSGIGRTVRDAYVAQQLQRAGAWTRLVCLHLAGRRPPESGAAITSMEGLVHVLHTDPRPGVLVEQIDLYCETNTDFWYQVLMAAVPEDPPVDVPAGGFRRLADVQAAIDQKRFVVVVCGQAAAQMVQSALQTLHPTLRWSEEQLQYVDVEEFM